MNKNNPKRGVRKPILLENGWSQTSVSQRSLNLAPWGEKKKKTREMLQEGEVWKIVIICCVNYYATVLALYLPTPNLLITFQEKEYGMKGD